MPRNPLPRNPLPRIQLALNVSDIDTAVDFYSKLFDAKPAKRRPGYANFAIAEPPLKLVLIENASDKAGTLNHLGVEVESTQMVAEAQQRLAAAGLSITEQDSVTCCYAVQDKVWADGPGGQPWEFYTVLADAGLDDNGQHVGQGAACCSSTSESSPTEAAPACC